MKTRSDSAKLRLVRRIDLATCFLAGADEVRIEALEGAMKIVGNRDHKASQALLRARIGAVDRGMKEVAQGIEDAIRELHDDDNDPDFVEYLLTVR